MELTSEQKLIRLVAEAFAVLTPTQMKTMAASMDLEWTEVYVLLEANEKQWEELKDEIALGPIPEFDADWEKRIPKPEANEIINSGDTDVLGICPSGKGTWWTVYHIAPFAGHRYFIGLDDSDDMWEVHERTARHYAEE